VKEMSGSHEMAAGV